MPRITPKSPHVLYYEYDPATKLMTVAFHNGKTYTHANVPSEAFTNMQRYRSAGEFYHAVIKRYPLVDKSK